MSAFVRRSAPQLRFVRQWWCDRRSVRRSIIALQIIIGLLMATVTVAIPAAVMAIISIATTTGMTIVTGITIMTAMTNAVITARGRGVIIPGTAVAAIKLST